MSSDLNTPRFVFMGNQSVGKTTLVRRLSTGEFSSFHPSTVGMEKGTVHLDYENKDGRRGQLAIEIVDTAGQQHLRDRVVPYFLSNGGHIPVIILDATLINTAIPASETCQQLNEFLDLAQRYGKQRPVLISLAKTDLLQDSVDVTELKQYTMDCVEAYQQRYHAHFSYSITQHSAKRSGGTDDFCEQLFDTYYDIKEQQARDEHDPIASRDIDQAFSYSIRDVWRNRNDENFLDGVLTKTHHNGVAQYPLACILNNPKGAMDRIRRFFILRNPVIRHRIAHLPEQQEALKQKIVNALDTCIHHLEDHRATTKRWFACSYSVTKDKLRALESHRAEIEENPEEALAHILEDNAIKAHRRNGPHVRDTFCVRQFKRLQEPKFQTCKDAEASRFSIRCG